MLSKGTTNIPLNETHTLRQCKDARSRSRQVATKMPMHWFYSKLSRNFGVSIAIQKCASLRQVQFKEIYNV